MVGTDCGTVVNKFRYLHGCGACGRSVHRPVSHGGESCGTGCKSIEDIIFIYIIQCILCRWIVMDVLIRVLICGHYASHSIASGSMIAGYCF